MDYRLSVLRYADCAGPRHGSGLRSSQDWRQLAMLTAEGYGVGRLYSSENPERFSDHRYTHTAN